jgi:hypothetical protein
MKREVAGLCAALFAVGCNGGGGGTAADGGGGDAGTPFQAFCLGLRETLVLRDGTCAGMPAAMAQGFENRDPCAAWTPGVADGTLLFDVTNAGACLSAVSARSCTTATPPAACAAVLRGTLPPGASCNVARQIFVFSECESGSRCVLGVSGACTGTCVRKAPDGVPCSNTQPCVDGEGCDGRTGLCAPLPASGETCGIPTLFPCAEGLYCTDIANGGTCLPLHATGGPCSADAECPSPDLCLPASGQPGATCTAPLPIGASCQAGSNDCGGFSSCAADGTCQRGVAPLIGQPCTGVCQFGVCDTSLPAPVCKGIAAGQLCRTQDDADCGPNALCAAGTDRTSRCTGACF